MSSASATVIHGIRRHGESSSDPSEMLSPPWKYRSTKKVRGPADSSGRERLYADIAHPIHQEGRDLVQARVVEAYQRELEASHQVGYVAPRFDDLDYDAYGEPAG